MLKSRLARIEGVLQENLKIVYLEIENESVKHSGHYSGDGESHWRMLVAATDFKGLSRVQRHQKINQLLASEYENGLHAMSLQLFDADEWQIKKSQYFPNSGGSSRGSV